MVFRFVNKPGANQILQGYDNSESRQVNEKGHSIDITSKFKTNKI